MPDGLGEEDFAANASKLVHVLTDAPALQNYLKSAYPDIVSVTPGRARVRCPFIHRRCPLVAKLKRCPLVAKLKRLSAEVCTRVHVVEHVHVYT